MALLEARDISKRFGGIDALSKLSLEIAEGESVGLVGPNGAGKTTLFNCLLGIEHPDTGSVHFSGVPIDALPTYQRARLGIGRTFQRLELFAGMTPREHLLVTERARSGTGALWKDLVGTGRPTTAEREQSDELLALVGLSDEADVPVEALSLGHGRLVELARALVGEPRLLMLDEPSSGLDGNERAELIEILRRVRQHRSAAVVLVEHDLEMVASVVERLLVLDFGKLIADGPLDQVLENQEVRRAYLGRARVEPTRLEEAHAPVPAATGGRRPILLDVRDVSASYGPYRALFSVSFSVNEGEAVALVGANGAGKSTVARVVSGLVPTTRGRILFDGKEVTNRPAWMIARLGLGHVNEGRSVLASLTVEENLELAIRPAVGRQGAATALERAYASYPQLAARKNQLAGTLSGGEQRLLALARVLAVPKRLLVVDELSLGLAPSVVDEVFETLRAVLLSGTSLLIVEQHVARALELVDRAVVLTRGRVSYEGRVEDAAQVVSGVLGPTSAGSEP